MSNAVLSHPIRETPPVAPGNVIAAGVLAAWLAAVAVFGADGAFVTPPGTPPVPIAVGAGAPLILFFAGVGLSRRFRAFLLGIDLKFMAAVQAWRFAGLGFIALYVYGILPGDFALPAGLGDIAMGVTAPGILLALNRRPDFAAGRTFVTWNLLGVLDLVVAVTTGTLNSALATGIPGEITTTPMAHLPLVFVPAFVVPILFMLHMAALMQTARLRRALSGRA